MISAQAREIQLYFWIYFQVPSYHSSNESRTLTKQSSSSSFYSSQNPVESLPENAFDEMHLALEDMGDFDRDLNDNASIGSSIGSGPLGTTGGPLGTGPLQVLQGIGSDPVSIPGSDIMRHHSFTSQTSTSPTSPLGHLGFFAATTVRRTVTHTPYLLFSWIFLTLKFGCLHTYLMRDVLHILLIVPLRNGAKWCS